MQFVLFLVLFGWVAIESAESHRMETFKVDSMGSMVGFEVSHLVISSLEGEFRRFQGSYSFDEQNSRVSGISFVIDATSLDTYDPDQNRRLLGPHFFDVKKYPRIVFESNEVIFENDRPVRVRGNLNLHGRQRPLTLDVRWQGRGKDPLGSDIQTFELMGVLNRGDFDLTWKNHPQKSRLLLGETVKLKVRIQSEIEQSPYQPAKKYGGISRGGLPFRAH